MINSQPLLLLCELVNGRAFKQTEWAESGLPIIRIQNLNDENKDFNYYQGDYDIKHEVNPGDLLFSWSGTPGSSFGAFFWNRGKGVLNQHIFNVRTNEAIVAKPYLRYALNQRLDQIIDRAHGAVGLQHITKAELSKVQIPLPPLPIQKKIAAILDAADALRAKRRESIEQLDSLVQATFLEMFGDPVTNPKGWHQAALKDTFTRSKVGPFGSLLHKSDYIQGGVPLVNPKHIRHGRIEHRGDETVSEAKAKELSEYRLECGDVLMGRRGEMGRCAVIQPTQEQWLCGTGSVLLRPDTRTMTSLYLCSLLSSQPMRKHLEHLSGGAIMPSLSGTQVQSLVISLPPIDVQTRFASIVESIEQQKTRLKAHLAELDTLFAALQSRAFNGELVA